MNNKVIIFDWSGVISDDRLPVYDANMKLLDIYGKDRITFEEWLPSTKASATEFLHSYGINVDHDKASEEYRKAFNKARSSGINPTIYSDAKKVLKKLADKDIKLFVISAHPAKNLKEEAITYDIDKFFVEFVGNCRDKAKAIRKIITSQQVKGEVYYIGDTTFDILAAKKARVKAIAITNGYHARDKLSSEKPDVIVSSLKEFLLLF